MKSTFSLLTLLFILVSFFSKSQNSENTEKSTWIKLIHIEVHQIFPSTDLKENIPIRQTVSIYNQYDINNEISKLTSRTWSQAYGIKAELYNKEYKIAISTGIKYWLYNSKIRGKVSMNADYFYFRYLSEGQEIKFARVNKLIENNHYISIPIDARVFILNRKRFGFFAKIGTDIGFNIHNNLDVVFFNPEMNPLKNEVLNVLEQSNNKLYAAINASLGFRYYYLEKVCFNFEIYLPSKYLGSDYFILTDLKSFSGFKASVQIPLSMFNSK